eukprot:1150479-Pelagomonas_calceolata.AAC.3
MPGSAVFGGWVVVCLHVFAVLSDARRPEGAQGTLCVDHGSRHLSSLGCTVRPREAVRPSHAPLLPSEVYEVTN